MTQDALLDGAQRAIAREGSWEGAPSGLHAPWGRGWRQPLEKEEEGGR